MTLKNDAKFREKPICSFKHGIRNLVNFQPTTQTSENFTSISSFCPNYLRNELKIYGGVIFHETEQWCKIWINPESVVSKLARELGELSLEYSKTWKIVLWWARLSKHIMFQLQNYMSWLWRVIQNLKENWLLA